MDEWAFNGVASNPGALGKILYVVRRFSDGYFRCDRGSGRMFPGWVKDPTSPGCVMSEEKARSIASPKRGSKGMEAVWLGDAIKGGAVQRTEDAVRGGLKLDDGKLRYELLDDAAEDEMVAVLSFGAVKYDPGNWRLVDDAFERYVGALRRHIAARRRGEKYDPETGLPHLAHAACCIHFLLAIEATAENLPGTLPFRLKRALETARKLRAERLGRGP